MYDVSSDGEMLVKIKEIASGLLPSSDFELVDIIFKRQGRDYLLRILLDRVGGITLEECAKLNRAIGDKLDELDVIGSRYLLEVCSPGIDRNLSTEKDFAKVVGKNLKVITNCMYNRSYDNTGKLVSVDDGNITLELVNGQTLAIELVNIKRANVEVVW